MSVLVRSHGLRQLLRLSGNKLKTQQRAGGGKQTRDGGGGGGGGREICALVASRVNRKKMSTLASLNRVLF